MKDSIPANGKHPGGRPRRELDREQLKRLLKEGYSLRQIARAMECGYGTVYRAARDL